MLVLRFFLSILRVYYFAHVILQILAELNLLTSKFTPGFDQTQKYFAFDSCKYFKIPCHANANSIYLGVFLFLDYKLDAESFFFFFFYSV